ncbi:hypothetical protein SK128_008971, partial [Halocaridina rubra]
NIYPNIISVLFNYAIRGYLPQGAYHGPLTSQWHSLFLVPFGTLIAFVEKMDCIPTPFQSTWNGFGMQTDSNAKIFSNTMEEIPSH